MQLRNTYTTSCKCSGSRRASLFHLSLCFGLTMKACTYMPQNTVDHSPVRCIPLPGQTPLYCRKPRAVAFPSCDIKFGWRRHVPLERDRNVWNTPATSHVHHPASAGSTARGAEGILNHLPPLQLPSSRGCMVNGLNNKGIQTMRTALLFFTDADTYTQLWNTSGRT